MSVTLQHAAEMLGQPPSVPNVGWLTPTPGRSSAHHPFYLFPSPNLVLRQLLKLFSDSTPTHASGASACGRAPGSSCHLRCQTSSFQNPELFGKETPSPQPTGSRALSSGTSQAAPRQGSASTRYFDFAEYHELERKISLKVEISFRQNVKPGAALVNLGRSQ